MGQRAAILWYVHKFEYFHWLFSGFVSIEHFYRLIIIGKLAMKMQCFIPWISDATMEQMHLLQRFGYQSNIEEENIMDGQ